MQRKDVVILGGGLAGLTLARHLLLHTDRTVHLLERRDALPPERQKVGESSVQLAGYYFSKVLDLEEYLFHEHFMKYNLRFYWKTGDGDAFEDYSAAYIRRYSNVASYQLDRNTFEAELLRRNGESERFHADLGVGDLEVDLAEDGDAGAGAGADHRVRYSVGGEERELRCRWVVDATGRRRFLAKKRELARENEIRHGAFFWWVDGLVDVEALTDLSNAERRMHPSRRQTGHLPAWLATNHFMDEGLWFWVIPLRHKTSLGLVFDTEVVDPKDVFSVDKATRWVCDRFPLFARDLPDREVLDFGGFRSYSHDCAQTIDAGRWAMVGESGRFSDPLYSPGSDLIAIYNTLVVDAIESDARGEDLEPVCRLHESLMRSVYQAYLPTYATSYDALGEEECFVLKYVWELAIYFGVYVFPFLNDLFTDRRFVLGFLRRFARLGPWNRSVQGLLSGFFQWKKEHGLVAAGEPRFFDFLEIGTLREAERCFYEVGVSVNEAKRVLDRQLDNFEELARFLGAHVASVVLGDPRVARSAAYVATLDPADLVFDPAEMAETWERCRDDETEQEWTYVDPSVLDPFRGDRPVAPKTSPETSPEIEEDAVAISA